jgi:hypothetical protein
MTTQQEVDAIIGKYAPVAWWWKDEWGHSTIQSVKGADEARSLHTDETVRAMLTEALLTSDAYAVAEMQVLEAMKREMLSIAPNMRDTDLGTALDLVPNFAEALAEKAQEHPTKPAGPADQAIYDSIAANYHKAQEPVAWYWADGTGVSFSATKPDRELCVPLFTAPPTLPAAEQAAALRMQEQCAEVCKAEVEKLIGIKRHDVALGVDVCADRIGRIPLETSALREMMMEVASNVRDAFGGGMADAQLRAIVDNRIAGKGEGKGALETVKAAIAVQKGATDA